MSDKPPVITATGLRKRFVTDGNWVLDGVDLSVVEGESVAIVGPSGSGKSTLLGILGSLEEPDEGEVQLGERSYRGLSNDQLAAVRREAIGFIFQDHHLLPQCTALQNVLLPLLARPGKPPSRAEQSRGTELLKGLGLEGRYDAWPHQLSTGERQRVAVARALVARPRLVLADEPTGSLDRKTSDALIPVLFEHGGGAAVVIVTHSERVASACDRVLELEYGQLIARKPD